MQDFCLFFYLLPIFVIFCKNNRSNDSEIRRFLFLFSKNNRSNDSEIRRFLFLFCKNNRSNGSEIRHKKCFFCTFSFLRPFKADTIHLCFVLRTSGWSFVVHCAGCHPAFFFVFRRILSAAFLHFPCFLFHFPCFLFHFPSFFLQNSCKFSLFPCTFHFFVLLLHPEMIQITVGHS